jgi:hypothetical protein
MKFDLTGDEYIAIYMRCVPPNKGLDLDKILKGKNKHLISALKKIQGVLLEYEGEEHPNLQCRTV